jgi:hypothetical protein
VAFPRKTVGIANGGGTSILVIQINGLTCMYSEWITTVSGSLNPQNWDISFLNHFTQQPNMPSQSNEANIILAVQAIHSDPKLSIRKAASIYNAPYTTLHHRLQGIMARRDCTPKSRALTKTEEETILEYVLNLDSRGFPPAIAQIEDMANIFRKSRDTTRIRTR